MAKRIKADVTMATGLMDTICPPSTQFAMYNKLNCNKKVLIYPECLAINIFSERKSDNKFQNRRDSL